MSSPAGSSTIWGGEAGEELDTEPLTQAVTDFPVGVVIHVDGVIRYANLAAARLHGMERPISLIGCQARDFVHP